MMLNELIIQDKKITWRKIKYKKISDLETHKNKKGAQIRVFPPKTPLMVLSKKNLRMVYDAKTRKSLDDSKHTTCLQNDLLFF